MPYDPKAIANYFIELAAAEEKQVTPLQLIKLVYIAHGWHLGLTGQPLINEPPEAWRFGPVIPSLYHALKQYGNEPITSKISEYQFVPGAEFRLEHVIVAAPPDETIRNFLKNVWKAYGHLSGLQLSALTHQPNTPWHQTWEKERAKYIKGVDIPDDLIIRHYRELHEVRAKPADGATVRRTAETFRP